MLDLSGALDRAEERAAARIGSLEAPELMFAYAAGVQIMRECMAEEIITAFIETDDDD